MLRLNTYAFISLLKFQEDLKDNSNNVKNANSANEEDD